MNGIIHEKCKGCPYISTRYLANVCNRYAHPHVFYRESLGLWLCPSQFVGDMESKQTTKIRVGQQKQRRR